jgi:hypothetical protein
LAETLTAIAVISLGTGVLRVGTMSCDDELVISVRMAKLVGLPYRLDFNMVTGVQTLVLGEKKIRFLRGKEVK